MRLLERRFTVRAPIEVVWSHLARVEDWTSWARHIRRIDLRPPGPLALDSEGTIHLTNGIRSTFRVTALNPGQAWKWVGPFLWIQVHYDHRLESRGPQETEVRFELDGEGFGVGFFGRFFAKIYARNLDRAIPRLIHELEEGTTPY